MKKKNFKEVAVELNTVLGLDPAIDITGSKKSVMEKIKEASELLEPEDELSEGTQQFLGELGVALYAPKKVEPKPAPEKVSKKKKAAVPVASNKPKTSKDLPTKPPIQNDVEKEVHRGPNVKPRKASMGGWVTEQIEKVNAGGEDLLWDDFLLTCQEKADGFGVKFGHTKGDILGHFKYLTKKFGEEKYAHVSIDTKGIHYKK